MGTNSISLCFDPLVPFGLPHMKLFNHSSLFLQRWSQWSWKVMILASSSFNVTNALPISIVLFLIGCDCDVHELFSWCCRCTYCVNHPLSSQSWSRCSSSLGVTDAFLISIILFLFNGGCDVYGFFYQCY